MHQEIDFKNKRKKKRSGIFSRKINFYKKPEEIPDEITAAEFQKISGKKKEPRIKNYIPKQYNGVIYHSTFEAKYAENLDWQIQSRDIKSWKRQVKIEINIKIEDGRAVLTDETMYDLKQRGIKAYHVANYYMDFVVTHKDDSIEYVETKGHPSDTWKIKYLLFEVIFNTLHPGITLTVVTQNGKKIK